MEVFDFITSSRIPCVIVFKQFCHKDIGLLGTFKSDIKIFPLLLRHSFIESILLSGHRLDYFPEYFVVVFSFHIRVIIANNRRIKIKFQWVGNV